MRARRGYDVVVVGLGAMGSATLAHLAAKGARVLGLDLFQVPHERGSSHGGSRIIRRPYFEDPRYVPLLDRAYALWAELEARVGQSLFVRTGSLDIGEENDPLFAGSLRSCQIHAIPHEVLTGEEVNARFPGYKLPREWKAVFQEDGGALRPERCIDAHLHVARSKGAEVIMGESVRRIHQKSNLIYVETDDGGHEAGSVVVAAGAWTGALVGLEDLLTPERQVLLWTEPIDSEAYDPGRFPVFNLSEGGSAFYGFPALDGAGVKIGMWHHLGEVVDPDDEVRRPGPVDERPLREFLERVLPGAAGPTLAMQPCMFTNTLDHHFILDRLPENEGVLVAAGFSGHGFKFASAVGSLLADAALGGVLPNESRFLSLDRFQPGHAS